jgi:hypothetical protein
MKEQYKPMTKPMTNTQYQFYLAGIIDGLVAFSWWKDGEQYVGTCGTTLKQAIAFAQEGRLFCQKPKP